MADLTEYEVYSTGPFALLRSADDSQSETFGYSRDEVPAQVEDREAYFTWLDQHTAGGDAYYTHIMVRDSDEVIAMKTSKANFYRQVNELIGPSPEDREAAKAHFHKFISAALKGGKAKKKAIPSKVVAKLPDSKVDPKRFAYFRPYHTYIIEMYGKLFSTKEIRAFLLEDHGVKVTTSTLTAFYKFHEDLISRQVSAFKESFADVRLGYKRSRLEEYAWLYHKLKKDFSNPKTPLARKTAFSKEMQSCLKAIKDEVEGNTITIDATMNVNMQIDAHLTSEVLDRKTVASVTLAKAAFALGVEPAGMLWEMERSYYKRFNSFLGNDPNADGLMLPDQEYKPGDYDFDRLDKQAERQQQALRQKEDEIKAKRMEMRKQIRDQGVRDQLKEALEISRKALSDSEPEV